MNPQQVWQAVLSELELTLSRANFTTWFKNTCIGDYQNGQVTICVPSVFYKDWLEKKFHHTLIKLIEKASGDPIRSLTYKIDPFNSKKSLEPVLAASRMEKTANLSQNSPREAVLNTPTPKPALINAFGLNSRHVFNNFIVGRGNELAHAAAQTVASRPGLAYNPLFVYGGVGLGKTHLIQAICNQVLSQDQSKKVLYVTSEVFTNEFINSVQTGRAREFKDHYRNIDVLIIDDIQFISGKESTQEELFNTFNSLHQCNRQVIVSSDRPPKAIPKLEPRLLSRFEWGLIVDVATPDLETRVAILKAKCQEKGQDLPLECLQLVASLVQNNVRELEGALNKILAYRDFKRVDLDPGLIRGLVASLENPASGRSLNIKLIIEVALEFFDIKLDELLSETREKRVAYPRQVIMFLLREELRVSFPAIGREIGNRDHTTAIHAYEKIKRLASANTRIFEELNQIKQKLYAIR